MLLRLFLLFSWVCLSARAAVEGEADSFAPAVNGTVRAMLAGTNGSVIIAGDFTEVNGVPRGGLARLLQDGTLDAAFAAGAGADGPIHCIVATSAGYYIGGDFLNFDGQARGRIARITSTGELNPAFAPGAGANATVRCLRSTTSSSATVWAGGDFTSMRGIGVGYFAILRGDGTFASEFGSDSFVSSSNKANGKVLAFAEASQGIFIGGEFTAWGGTNAGRLVRISSSLTNLKAGGFNGPVTALLGGTNGGSFSESVICFGSFTQYAGQSRNGFAQITISTLGSSAPLVLRESQNSLTGGAVRCAVRGALTNSFAFTQVWTGGDFTGFNGYPAQGVASFEEAIPFSSLESYNLLAPRYTSNQAMLPSPAVLAMARGPGDRVYVGGSFSKIGTNTRTNIARLLGPSLNTLPSTVTSLTVSPLEGSSVAMTWNNPSGATSFVVQRRRTEEGVWTDLFETPRRWAADSSASPSTSYTYRVLSKNAAGTVTEGNFKTIVTESVPWTGSGTMPTGQTLPSFPPGTVADFDFHGDGRTLVCGFFGGTAGGLTKSLTRLLPSGLPDPGFTPPGDLEYLWTVKLQADGKILIGGGFTKVAGTARFLLARLNPDGSLDPTFTSPFTSYETNLPRDIGLLPDGRIAVLRSSSIMVLHPNGQRDESFNAPWAFNYSLSSIPRLTVLPDGRLIVSGLSSFTAGTTGSVMILRADGSIDHECQGRIGEWDLYPDSADCDASGRIYLCGNFQAGTGGPRCVARFHPDGRLDSSFMPTNLRNAGTTSSEVNEVRVMRDGKILAYGGFQLANNTVVPGIVRLLPDGSFDPSFRALPTVPIRFDSTFWYTPAALEIDELNRVWIGRMGESPTTVAVPELICLDTITAAPTTPQTVNAEPWRTGGILLSWANPPESYLTRVEGRLSGTEEWEVLAELPQPIASWHHHVVAPGDEWDYRLVSLNKEGSAAPAILAPVTAFNPAQLWAAAQGVSDVLDLESDPDNDGMPLLLEYALGGSAAAPGDPQPESWIMFERLYFIYPRPREDLNYVVEKSHGGDWTSEGVAQGPAGLTGFASVPMAGHSRTFLRLRVTPK
jgi:uncharacterized delta-60 repeat protein